MSIYDLNKEVVRTSNLKEKILGYRDQERILDYWLKRRFETVLPRIMKRAGIDTWVVACNEYNEDPVLKTLVPCAMMTARRFTILLFHLDGDEVKRYNITRPNVGLDDLYEAVWINQKGSSWVVDPTKAETQVECLNRMLHEVKAEKIGLNFSKTFAFADGLSHTVYEEIMEGLDADLKEKIVSAENVCVGWLETRSEEEKAAYYGIMQIAHTMIAEAFSSNVVIPGVTTNRDVKYWMLDKVIELGLKPWFDFEVSIKRKGVGNIDEEATILPGDVLHCDVGLIYLNLYTDTQENAYVLRPGEEDVPEDLKKAMANTNRVQDITLSFFKEGRSGNEILKLAREKCIEEGLDPKIYTHPIGYHGHAAGPTIGLYDKQEGVPGGGDYLLYNDTCYSLELNNTTYVESWDTNFTLGAETDVMFADDKTYFLYERQTKFHIIK